MSEEFRPKENLSSPSLRPKKKISGPILAIIIIASVLFLCCVFSLIFALLNPSQKSVIDTSSPTSLSSISLKEETSQTTEVTITSLTTTSTSAKPTATPTPSESTTMPTPPPTTTAETPPPTTALPTAPAQPMMVDEPEPQEIIVYITNTGKKYHREGCQYLKKSCIPISLDQAKLSYDPCKVCHPPT